jgi:hypothetical protein
MITLCMASKIAYSRSQRRCSWTSITYHQGQALYTAFSTDRHIFLSSRHPPVQQDVITAPSIASLTYTINRSFTKKWELIQRALLLPFTTDTQNWPQVLISSSLIPTRSCDIPFTGRSTEQSTQARSQCCNACSPGRYQCVVDERKSRLLGRSAWTWFFTACSVPHQHRRTKDGYILAVSSPTISYAILFTQPDSFREAEHNTSFVGEHLFRENRMSAEVRCVS